MQQYNPSAANNLEFQHFYPQYQTPSTSSFTQERTFVGSPFGTGGYSDEPPLLVELGINLQHIKYKSLSVLLLRQDKHIMDDTDLAGPLFFCLLFGACLLLSGKVHFGYIYGIAVLGCGSMYGLLNMMSECGVDVYRTVSVLGYSLLPLVLLSVMSPLVTMASSLIVMVLSVFAILWCTYAATVMFVSVLQMNKDQFVLVGYPVLLFYAVFGLFTVF